MSGFEGPRGTTLPKSSFSKCPPPPQLPRNSTWQTCIASVLWSVIFFHLGSLVLWIIWEVVKWNSLINSVCLVYLPFRCLRASCVVSLSCSSSNSHLCCSSDEIRTNIIKLYIFPKYEWAKMGFLLRSNTYLFLKERCSIDLLRTLESGTKKW